MHKREVHCSICGGPIWLLEFMGKRQGAGYKVSLHLAIADLLRSRDSFQFEMPFTGLATYLSTTFERNLCKKRYRNKI
jgi:hypothetical protein